MNKRQFSAVVSILGFALACAGCAGRSEVAPKPVRRIEIRTGQHAYSYQGRLHYLLYVPPAYAEPAGARWPLLVFLHGMGERGDSLATVEYVDRHGPPKLAAAGVFPDFIVLSPQCHTSNFWDAHFDDIIGLIEELKQSYSIDPGRVYLTGLSMGGYGTWELAGRHPEIFAAAAPIAGGYWDSRTLSRLPALKDMPLWVFHGARDSVVPAAMDQEMVAALESLGAKPRFTLYPDADHSGSWEQAYADPELYAWLLRQRIY
jgi:predicted peptidase